MSHTSPAETALQHYKHGLGITSHKRNVRMVNIPAASETACFSPSAYQMPHCTLSSWNPSPSLRLQKKDYIKICIIKQLAYSLHVVCDLRAELVGVVKKNLHL